MKTPNISGIRRADVEGSNMIFMRRELIKMRLDPFAFTVYANLVARANDQRKAWPGHARMAEDCSMSRRKVADCIKRLEALNMVEIEHRIVSGGQDTNMYVLTDPSVWVWPEACASGAGVVHTVHGGGAPHACPPMHTVLTKDTHSLKDTHVRSPVDPSNLKNPESGEEKKPLSSTKVFQRDMIIAFKRGHERRFGGKYHVTGQDARAAGILAGLGLTVEALMEIWEAVWKLKDRAVWEQQMAAKLGTFASQIQPIRVKVGRVKAPSPDTDMEAFRR